MEHKERMIAREEALEKGQELAHQYFDIVRDLTDDEIVNKFSSYNSDKDEWWNLATLIDEIICHTDYINSLGVHWNHDYVRSDLIPMIRFN